MQTRPTKWVTGTVGFLAAIWFVGAYFDTTSNLWVLLGVLSPAGHSHLWTFPAAYPAVGVTLPTLTTLAGGLAIAYAGLRWVSYTHRDDYAQGSPDGITVKPLDAGRPSPGSPSPRTSAPSSDSLAGAPPPKSPSSSSPVSPDGNDGPPPTPRPPSPLRGGDGTGLTDRRPPSSAPSAD